MPVYNYVHPSTGLAIEFIRSVDERNDPLTITFVRSNVPERTGRIIVSGSGPGPNDEFKRGCYELEQKNPDAWNKGTPKSDYIKAFNMPPPPKGPGAEGTYGEQ